MLPSYYHSHNDYDNFGLPLIKTFFTLVFILKFSELIIYLVENI